jgi:hypothetical protein
MWPQLLISVREYSNQYEVCNTMTVSQFKSRTKLYCNNFPKIYTGLEKSNIDSSLVLFSSLNDYIEVNPISILSKKSKVNPAVE